MNRFRWLLAWLAVAVALPSGVAAQSSGTITGQVVEAATQRPLSGVQVVVAGTNRGALTNQQGQYVIPNAPVGTQTVRAILIGFAQGEQQVEVVAGESVSANFGLKQSAVELDAVVVNAVTGEAERKRELGTNTAAIQMDDVNQAQITKLADVLTGRTAGVSMQGVAGTTGTGQKIRIRGANSLSLSNEPLVFVDGVQINTSTDGLGVGGQEPSRLNDINPEDIAKMEVLKGPAASAMYGTAAANGVILITTKRGTAGTQRWNAYVETASLEDVTDYPANWLTYQVNQEGAEPFVDGRLNSGEDNPAVVACSNIAAAQGKCRQDATISFNTLRDARTTPYSVGNRRKYGLSVSGGSDAVTYYLSGETMDERGVIDYNSLGRSSLRANLNAKLRDDLTVQVTSGYTHSNLGLNSNDNSIFSPIINGITGKPVYVEGEDGKPADSNYGWGFTQDELRNLVTYQDVDRFISGVSANYRPFSWLSANASVGLDFTSQHDFETLQPGRLPIAQSYAIGFRQSDRSNYYNYTGNASATASFDLTSNIASTTTVGTSYQRNLMERTECYGAGIVEGTRSCGATSSLYSVDEDFYEVITLGGFLQQQLAFNDRVFLTGAIRGDDDSAFGSNFGLIYYPSVSLSWVVLEEPWFPETGFLSDLRLRSAYGVSGLRPGFRDAVTLFAPVSVAREGGDISGVTLNATGNTQLKPERTKEYEMGLDAGLFDNRIGVEFTYFNKTSTDALIRRRLAPSYGLTASVFDNLGSVKNQGTELAVNMLALDLPEARLNVRYANTLIENEILALGEGVEPIVFNRGNQRHQEGFPAGAFFQREISFDDANGDGKLSPDEVTLGDTAVFLGQSLPTHTNSVSADLTLFDFITVTTLFEQRGGNKQLNDTESFRCYIGQVYGDRGCEATQDPNASLENQARFIADYYKGSAAGYIEDADFVKWRELSVTVSAPATLAQQIPALSGTSLTLSGRNLATWTDYTGLDPEANETGGSAGSTGGFRQGEFNTQPPVRYFTARLNITF